MKTFIDDTQSESEVVVFCDEQGNPTGETGPKLASHTADTKLHLAFSCYIFRKSDGKFLMTQRALHKRVWPSVWTNSVCGHVAPNETFEEALYRRASYELGLIDLSDVEVLVPDYVYTTTPYNGIVDHEFCPIFRAFTDEEPVINPDEVADYTWIEWSEYVGKLNNDTADIMSWWSKDQYELIKEMTG